MEFNTIATMSCALSKKNYNYVFLSCAMSKKIIIMSSYRLIRPIGSQEHNTRCPQQDLNLRPFSNLLKTYDHQARCFTLFIRNHILPPFKGLCQSLCRLVQLYMLVYVHKILAWQSGTYTQYCNTLCKSVDGEDHAKFWVHL